MASVSLEVVFARPCYQHTVSEYRAELVIKHLFAYIRECYANSPSIEVILTADFESAEGESEEAHQYILLKKPAYLNRGFTSFLIRFTTNRTPNGLGSSWIAP